MAISHSELHHPVATLLTKHQWHGLMICGINWGGPPLAPILNDQLGLFSDKSRNPSRFKSRMHTVFKLWGHPLDEDNPTEFEQSIIHTNWLSTKTPRCEDQHDVDNLIEHADSFMKCLAYYRPSMIIFTSVNLLYAFRQLDLEPLFGGLVESGIGVYPRDTYGRQFETRWAKLMELAAVSIPHPTGARGLTNQYLEQMRDRVGPMLDNYKKEKCSFSDGRDIIQS